MSKLAHTTSAISIQFREIDFANNYIFHATIISIAWRGFLETFALDAPVVIQVLESLRSTTRPAQRRDLNFS